MATKCLAPNFARLLLLVPGRAHGRYVAPPLGQVLHSQVPETADADDRDPVGRPHTVLQDRGEHGGARAHQRSGMLGLDLVRQRKGELPVVDPHVRGERTVVAAKDRQCYVRAEVLEAALAPLALHTRSAHGPDSDPLADLESIDLGPDGRDDADRLVPGHQRVLVNPKSLSTVAASVWQIPQWVTRTSTWWGPIGPGSYSNGSNRPFADKAA